MWGRGDDGGERKRVMGGRKRGMKEKGKGKGKGRGKGGKEEEGSKAGGTLFVAADAVSGGQSSLATAKPHSSLPLAVADPNFLQFLTLLPLVLNHLSPHLRSSRLPIPCPEVMCPISPTSAHRMIFTAFILRRLFPSLPLSPSLLPTIPPIQLDAFRCFGTRLPFLLTNVDPSHNLPSKTWFTHSPATTSITTMNATT